MQHTTINAAQEAVKQVTATTPNDKTINIHMRGGCDRLHFDIKIHHEVFGVSPNQIKCINCRC